MRKLLNGLQMRSWGMANCFPTGQRGRCAWVRSCLSVASFTMLLVILGCDQRPESLAAAPTPTPLAVRIVPDAPPALTGEAFLKLERDVDYMAGLEIRVYDSGLVYAVEAASKDSQEAAGEVALLTERVRLLKEAMGYGEAGLKWFAWEEKLRSQMKDFDAKGYSSLVVEDPILLERREFNWHKDRYSAIRWFEDRCAQCKERGERAQREVKRIVEHLQILPSQDIAKELVTSEQQLAKARQRNRERWQILQRAMDQYRPRHSVRADSKGRFTIADLPKEQLAFVAAYREPIGGNGYYWMETVNFDGNPVSVILTQANAWAVEKAPR